MHPPPEFILKHLTYNNLLIPIDPCASTLQETVPHKSVTNNDNITFC